MLRPGSAMGVALAVVALLLVGCAEKGPAAEVDGGSRADRSESTPPAFPDQGVVPVALLIDGLVFDLTDRPVDLDYWAAPTDQARCAAEAIVDTLGAGRLSALGYRPGVPGASLNDIALTDAEREQVADAVEGCVDMVQAVAAMFFGDGRIAPTVARCLAQGLGDADQLRPFVIAVVFGTAVDPFANGSALADALLDQSVICVPEEAFNWSDLDLPGGPPVLDSDAPAGVPGSPFVDDQPDPTTTTTP